MALSKPSTIWLAVTEDCNNRCSWCYAQNNNSEAAIDQSAKHNMMDLGDAKIILNTFKEVGVKRCIMIGGEPTLHPKLEEIIKLAKLNEIESILVTNGRRAKDLNYAETLAKAGLDRVTVSMHGWSPESYEGQGNRPLEAKAKAFNEAIQGYNNLKNVGLHTGLNIVLSRLTQGNTANLINFLINLHVQQLGFNIAAPAVSRDSITGNYTLSIDEYRDHVLDVFFKCRTAGIHPSFQLGLPLCIFEKKEIEMMKMSKSIKQGCHVLNGGGIVINPDITPAICTHLMDFKLVDKVTAKEIFLNKKNFCKFWNSDELTKLRNIANVYRTDKCKNCDLWKECGSGCMIHWTYHDPTKIKIRYFKLNGYIGGDPYANASSVT